MHKYKLSKSKTIYIEPNVCSNKRTVWNNNKQKRKICSEFTQFKLLKILFKKYSFLGGYSRISEIQTK